MGVGADGIGDPPRAVVRRTARATDPSMSKAARKNARPGNTKGALGWIEAAKRTPYRTGPMTAVTPLMLAFAPCSWPCCDGLTKRVMRLCSAGCTRPIGAKTKMATTKMIQFDAKPHTRRAAVPNRIPTIIAIRSPYRSMKRLTTRTCTVMLRAPTSPRESPTSVMPHPIR